MRLRIAHDRHANPQFARHGDTFRDVAQSFQPLLEEDRARILERRLRVRQSREGESLVAFLQRTGGTWCPAAVAIANGLEDDARLVGEELLKVPIRQGYTSQSP